MGQGRLHRQCSAVQCGSWASHQLAHERCLPATYYLLLTTNYLRLTTYYLLPAIYYLLLSTYYLLLTTYCLLLTTYYLLLTTYYLLLTTYYSLLTAAPRSGLDGTASASRQAAGVEGDTQMNEVVLPWRLNSQQMTSEALL